MLLGFKDEELNNYVRTEFKANEEKLEKNKPIEHGKNARKHMMLQE